MTSRWARQHLKVFTLFMTFFFSDVMATQLPINPEKVTLSFYEANQSKDFTKKELLQQVFFSEEGNDRYGAILDYLRYFEPRLVLNILMPLTLERWWFTQHDESVVESHLSSLTAKVSVGVLFPWFASRYSCIHFDAFIPLKNERFAVGAGWSGIRNLWRYKKTHLDFVWIHNLHYVLGVNNIFHDPLESAHLRPGFQGTYIIALQGTFYSAAIRLGNSYFVEERTQQANDKIFLDIRYQCSSLLVSIGSSYRAWNRGEKGPSPMSFWTKIGMVF